MLQLLRGKRTLVDTLAYLLKSRTATTGPGQQRRIALQKNSSVYQGSCLIRPRIGRDWLRSFPQPHGYYKFTADEIKSNGRHFHWNPHCTVSEDPFEQLRLQHRKPIKTSYHRTGYPAQQGHPTNCKAQKFYINTVMYCPIMHRNRYTGNSLRTVFQRIMATRYHPEGIFQFGCTASNLFYKKKGEVCSQGKLFQNHQ